MKNAKRQKNSMTRNKGIRNRTMATEMTRVKHMQGMMSRTRMG